MCIYVCVYIYIYIYIYTRMYYDNSDNSDISFMYYLSDRCVILGLSVVSSNRRELSEFRCIFQDVQHVP